MKVLVNLPLSTYSGYGNDGLGIVRALIRLGADVYLKPSHVDPPLPSDLAMLLTKRLEAPFDLFLCHLDPTSIDLMEASANASDVNVAWTMWETTTFDNAPYTARRSMSKRLKYFDLLIGYDSVTGTSLGPYAKKVGVPMGKLQGGFDPEFWQGKTKTTRDWHSDRFGFAQPLDAKVLTPSGWKLMGDLFPGDLLIDPEGGWQKVEEVYDRGELPIYEVTLKDGSVTRCSADHLWQARSNGSSQWQVRTTAEMLDAGLRDRTGWRWELPGVLPVAYEPQADLPLDPYVLGALLGDGTLSGERTGVSIVSIDQGIFDQLEARLPASVVPKIFQDQNYRRMRLLGMTKIVRALGLAGTTSHTKFVPPLYLTALPEDRLLLLQGLMDTDGTVSSKGTPVFCSHNLKLAQAVTDLVHSLGGGASMKRYPSGQYLVHISDIALPFLLTRKSEKVLVRKRAYRRSIVSIQEITTAPARCISVTGDSHTYVTDDFVVTHNCMVGQLHPRKNPYVAIEAFRNLKLAHPEEFEGAELHMKTNIPSLHPAMEQWCPKLRIHYATWPESTLREFYKTQHVLLAPSRGEGKNLPALEMLATGGTVIATNFGGHTEWLRNEYAYPLNFDLEAADKQFPKALTARAHTAHLEELMWQTFTNREEARLKGALGASMVPKAHNWDHTMERFFLTVKDTVKRDNLGEKLWMKYRMCRPLPTAPAMVLT